jgi:hypothetical protein
MHFHTGINSDVLRVLEAFCEKLKPENRVCVVLWDEMSMNELVQYDKLQDCLEGIEDMGRTRRLLPATEALVVMISGIRESWSFLVSFYFSNSNTKSDKLQEIVVRNIESLLTIGFRVRMGICDMSFTNQGLYRRLKVTEDSPFIEVKNSKIYLVHDTPHLIKLVRNNLMSKNFQYYQNQTDKVQTAKWRDIVLFYENDTKLLPRTAPKLTKLRICVKDFTKGKVKLATQIILWLQEFEQW